MKSYRTEILKYRRKRSRKVFLVGVVVFLAVGLSALFFLNRKGTKNDVAPLAELTVNAETVSQKAELRQELQKTFVALLVWGGESGGKGSKAQALLIANPQKNNYLLLNVPRNTFTDLPGFGYSKISQAMKMGGISTLSATLSNLIQQSVTYYLFFPEDQSGGKDELEKLILSSKKSNFLPQDLMALHNELKNEGYDEKNFPTKKSESGKKEPDIKKLRRLLRPFFAKKDRKTIEVVILNGSGVPGVAATFAEQLVKDGYKVKETKNADKFDYAESVIINRNASEQEADKILKFLGVGRKEETDNIKEKADIVIIVGKDYRI